MGVVIYQRKKKQSLLLELEKELNKISSPELEKEPDETLSPELEKELNEKIVASLELLNGDISVIREGCSEHLYECFFKKEFVSRCLDIFGLDMDTAMTESKGLRRKEQNEVLSLLTCAKSVEEVKQILSNVKDPALFLCLKNSYESCLSEKKGFRKKKIVADITEAFRLQVQKLENLCDEIKTVWDLDHVSVHSKEKDEEFLIALVQKSILYCLFLKTHPKTFAFLWEPSTGILECCDPAS